VIGIAVISQSEFCRSSAASKSWLFFKMETRKRRQIPTTHACKKFSFRGLRIFITLDFRDSTFVTIFRDKLLRQAKIQTSQQRQRPTQYAHTGDFTMGYAHRPSAYRA